MKKIKLILALLLISGCSITPQTATQVATYNFAINTDTNQTIQKSTPNGKKILVVPVIAPAWLDNRAMHYRLDYYDRVQSYTYAHSRWSSSPALLLTQQIKQKIANETPHLIINDSSMAIAENKLHIALEEFSQIFNSEHESYVAISFRASLINKSHQLIAQQVFDIHQNTLSPNAEGAASAFSTASNQLVEDLIHWLQTELNRI